MRNSSFISVSAKPLRGRFPEIQIVFRIVNIFSSIVYRLIWYVLLGIDQYTICFEGDSMDMYKPNATSYNAIWKIKLGETNRIHLSYMQL